MDYALIDCSLKPTPLVPDISYLQQFVNGNLGIAKAFKLNSIKKNITQLTSNNKDIYLNQLHSSVINSDISVPDVELNGLSALERTLFQSIFETQKPYIEIVKLILNNLVYIEDIIARVLSLGTSVTNPYYYNKAVGYGDSNKNLGTMQQILENTAKLDNFINLNKNSKSINPIYDHPNVIKYNFDTSISYKIISIVYSTGEYDSNVNYEYIYIDIIDRLKTLSDGIYDIPDDYEDYSDYPDTVIFTICDETGTVLEDKDIPEWIKNNSKWYGNYKFYDTGLNDLQLYTNYLKDHIRKSTNDESIIDEIASNGDYNDLMTYCKQGGFLYQLKDKGDMPDRTLIPQQISINNKSVYVDGELDYDLKLFKIEPFTILNTQEAVATGYSPDPSNSKLYSSLPYSQNTYGIDDNGEPYPMEILYYTTIELLPKTYYILEGVKQELEDFTIGKKKIKSKRKKRRYNSVGINKLDFIFAIKPFSSIITNIFSKLIPAIKQLLSLIKSPAQFVTDIITSKLGDGFGADDVKFQIFSSASINEFKQLIALSPLDRPIFATNSKYIKNYVHVDSLGNYKFILDGAAIVNLLGVDFGIDISNMLMKLVFKTPDGKYNIGDEFTLIDVTPSDNISLNSKITEQDTIPSTTVTSTTWYSTGEYKEDYQYDYYYFDNYISNILQQAYDSINSNDPSINHLSKTLYETAYRADKANVLDNTMQNLRSLYKGIMENPIVNFILNMVSFPLKLIKSIIKYIMDFFKSLTSITKIPSKIAEFVTFKWLTDIIKPSFILELIGIKFDVSELKNWVKGDVKMDKYDLSSVISAPFIPKLPTVTFEQLNASLLQTPLEMIISILKLLEEIIKSVIKFIWALFGIDAVTKEPVVKMINDDDQSNIQDIYDIIIDVSQVDEFSQERNNNLNNIEYIYSITLDNGDVINNLSNYELLEWIQNNNNKYEINKQY